MRQGGIGCGDRKSENCRNLVEDRDLDSGNVVDTEPNLGEGAMSRSSLLFCLASEFNW